MTHHTARHSVSELSSNYVERASRPITGIGREALAEPLLPIALLAITLTAATVLELSWMTWALFAALAGYSLSGST